MHRAFVDFSDFCRAETNIRPWRSMLKGIKEGNKKTKWEDRVPYAYWKGNPHVSPWRGELMQCNVTDQNDWNTRLYIQVTICTPLLHFIVECFLGSITCVNSMFP